MISKFKFNLVAVLILAFGVIAGAALAQDTTTTPSPDQTQRPDRPERHGGFRRGEGGPGFGGGMRGGPMGMLRGIDLTDAQKAQIKSIMDANKPDQATLDQMKALREARKNGTALTDDQKAQLKAARQAQAEKMKSVHEQIMNVLTAEQKAQLEKRRQEFEQRGPRGPRGPRKPDAPSTDKTTKPIDG
jgi:Spy/CpxP family protein refolding chaperone